MTTSCYKIMNPCGHICVNERKCFRTRISENDNVATATVVVTATAVHSTTIPTVVVATSTASIVKVMTTTYYKAMSTCGLICVNERKWLCHTSATNIHVSQIIKYKH